MRCRATSSPVCNRFHIFCLSPVASCLDMTTADKERVLALAAQLAKAEAAATPEALASVAAAQRTALEAKLAAVARRQWRARTPSQVAEDTGSAAAVGLAPIYV